MSLEYGTWPGRCPLTEKPNIPQQALFHTCTRAKCPLIDLHFRAEEPGPTWLALSESAAALWVNLSKAQSVLHINHWLRQQFEKPPFDTNHSLKVGFYANTLLITPISGSHLLNFACNVIVVSPKLHVLALFFVWFIWHVYWQRNDGYFLVCHEVVIVGFDWGPPLSLCNSQLNPRLNHWSSVCQSQRTWLSRRTGHAHCPWPRPAKTGACAYCCMTHVKWMVPVYTELPFLHSSCTVCMFLSAAKQLKCHFSVYRRCHT